ncbi:hypothetical protein Pla175_29260 [Pirellulimonas nuda]|uniref:Major Facilitator Superfamily protein n=1 Tax=Pirellulimonas nuda TaxID=2528009 RepID=A0A518DDH4_9BACT|nr:DUF5690 family protein [Pirellulimonas nuda]QDU89534.1 hypothetical protein Pla175_29260 [Pirellulimonas nuda]
MPPRISVRLEQASPAVFSAYCIAASFGVYFCMYAFRKPFTAGTFSGVELYGLDYKTVLVVSQVLGYTLSKFIGIRFIAEARPGRRAASIVALIAAAHAALLLFGVVPSPYNFVFLFLNGLPLGMVFGLVLGFLEGRRVTEALSAGLCASFIVSSGAVKTVGQALLLWGGVSEYWMPFVTGLVFWPPLLVCVWLLAQIPAPTQADVALRAERTPIDRVARRALLRRHGVGLLLLVAVFTLLTILRSVRDDFAVEVWSALGYDKTPSVFTISETLVMFAAIAINGLAFLIPDNRTAFFTAIYTILAGFVVIGLVTLLYLGGGVDGFTYMVVVGIGAYVPYVAFHTTLFERMIALFRDRANLGYLMYLADAFGYLGYVLVLLAKDVASFEANYLRLLIGASLAVSLASLVMMGLAYFYFRRQTDAARFEQPALAAAHGS